jgi:hypothetical protein
MKVSKLFHLSLVFLMITAGVIVSVKAEAAPVNWNSEYYEAYASSLVGSTFDEDTQIGPPLPLLAESYARGYVNCCSAFLGVSSSLSATSMAISYNGIHGANHASGYTEFSGNYTADNSFFVFSYDYGSIFDTFSVVTSSLFIDVTDLSTSTSLFTETITAPYTESGAYYIETPIGNNIGVNFRLELDASDIWTGGHDYGSSVGYSMTTSAVAPEPISSILFIAGGAMLFGRRYLRRKRGGQRLI